MGNGPEKEHNCKSTGKSRHDIYHYRDLCSTPGKHREKTPHDHKQWRTWWVTYLKGKSSGNKLAAIPEARSWFNGQQINSRCHKEREPTTDCVIKLVPFCNHAFNYILNPFFQQWFRVYN